MDLSMNSFVNSFPRLNTLISPQHPKSRLYQQKKGENNEYLNNLCLAIFFWVIWQMKILRTHTHTHSQKTVVSVKLMLLLLPFLLLTFFWYVYKKANFKQFFYLYCHWCGTLGFFYFYLRGKVCFFVWWGVHASEPVCDKHLTEYKRIHNCLNFSVCMSSVLTHRCCLSHVYIQTQKHKYFYKYPMWQTPTLCLRRNACQCFKTCRGILFLLLSSPLLLLWVMSLDLSNLKSFSN